MKQNPWPKETLSYLEELLKYLRMDNQIQASLEWIEKGVSYCQKTNMQEELIELELMKGYTHYYMNQRDKALTFFDNAFSMAQKINKEITNGNAYRLLGSIYWFEFNFPKRNSFRKSFTVFKTRQLGRYYPFLLYARLDLHCPRKNKRSLCRC